LVSVTRSRGHKMSATRYTALIIPARLGESVRIESLDTGPEVLRGLVGGEIESITRGDWHVYLNAEGTIINLPANLRAGQLMHECGLDLAGTARGQAVLLGRDDHGRDTDVPEHLVRLAEELFGAPLAA
jgi:hypothetical protein